jgi:hypothetical protein
MRAVAKDRDAAEEAAPIDPIDAEIERVLNATLGAKRYFAKPSEFCEMVGWSRSKYDRARRAGLLETTPQGSYNGISRPVLRELMRNGLGPISKKIAASAPLAQTASNATSAPKRRRKSRKGV